jgi:hypothetical protein
MCGGIIGSLGICSASSETLPPRFRIPISLSIYRSAMNRGGYSIYYCKSPYESELKMRAIKGALVGIMCGARTQRYRVV